MEIRQIQDMLFKRKISVPELTGEFLRRIREKDKQFNSYITVSEELATAQAETAQKRIEAGDCGTLLGIPVSVKDNICTKGIRTTCASRMLADYVPDYDATVIERMDGAVMLGKTNMDEFSMGSTGQTSYFGGVKNPYQRDCVPGGSSGGAAAAVAAGLCQAALCSDTGGSVRQPAAFCGVTGLKPTYGLVSRYGLIAFASSLDQIGVIAKSAVDCGTVLSAIVGKDPRDMTTQNALVVNPSDKIGQSVKGLRIGIPAEFFQQGIDPAVRDAVLGVAKFYEQQGCILVETRMPSLAYAVSAYYFLSSAQAAANLARYDGVRYGYAKNDAAMFSDQVADTRADGFGWEVKRRIMLGNYALSGGYYDQYYQNAVRIQKEIIADFSRQFANCDVLLTPTAPTGAYPIGTRSQVEMYMEDFCTVAVNLAGLPAISTTCGYDAVGMPIGMSLVGQAFGEATIIGAADVFEKNFWRQEADV